MERQQLRIALTIANERLVEAAKWQDKNAKKIAVYDWISSRLTWLIVIVAVLGVIILLLKFTTIGASFIRR